jgi:hypothetical protein
LMRARSVRLWAGIEESQRVTPGHVARCMEHWYLHSYHGGEEWLQKLMNLLVRRSSRNCEAAVRCRGVCLQSRLFMPCRHAAQDNSNLCVRHSWIAGEQIATTTPPEEVYRPSRRRRVKCREEISEERYRCECCHWSFKMWQMRVLKGDGGAMRGLYCTDCFYCYITSRNNGAVGRSYARRRTASPNMEMQETIEYNQLLVRSTEHRDLRWEYGLLGGDVEKYSRGAVKRKSKRSPS